MRIVRVRISGGSPPFFFSAFLNFKAYTNSWARSRASIGAPGAGAVYWDKPERLHLFLLCQKYAGWVVFRGGWVGGEDPNNPMWLSCVSVARFPTPNLIRPFAVGQGQGTTIKSLGRTSVYICVSLPGCQANTVRILLLASCTRRLVSYLVLVMEFASGVPSPCTHST